MFQGMVDLELNLLTSMEAERSPVGRGRNEPDALPPPLYVSLFLLFFIKLSVEGI